LPQSNIADEQEGTSKAAFSQSSGRFEHPSDQSNITGGRMEVVLEPGLISLSISNFSSDSGQKKVREAVSRIPGTSTYERVSAKSLPSDAKFREHRYLVFAKSVTNKQGKKFSAAEGDFFPVVVVADGDSSAYASLTRGPVSYQVRFTSPASFTATFTVSRATAGTLAFNGISCGAFNAAGARLKDQSKAYGVKIEVSGIPQNLLNDFPVPSGLYVVALGNGGMVANIGSCSLFYDSENSKTGFTKLEFQRS
jgi:hypothetical protein